MQFADLTFKMAGRNPTEAELADVQPQIERALAARGLDWKVFTISVIEGVVVVTLTAASIAASGWVAVALAVGAALAAAGFFVSMWRAWDYTTQQGTLDQQIAYNDLLSGLDNAVKAGILTPAQAAEIAKTWAAQIGNGGQSTGSLINSIGGVLIAGIVLYALSDMR